MAKKSKSSDPESSATTGDRRREEPKIGDEFETTQSRPIHPRDQPEGGAQGSLGTVRVKSLDPSGSKPIPGPESNSNSSSQLSPVERQDTLQSDFWSNPEVQDGSAAGDDLKADFSLWLRNQNVLGSGSKTLLEESRDDDLGALDAPLMPTAVEEVYEDRGEIGQGGMGTVRQVFDRRLRREAALKILKQDVGARHREVRRFIEEAQITGQLDHPNIVPIHELGQDAQGSHYFTMKLVQGSDFETILADLGERRLEPDILADNLQVFIKVCEAVAFAHSRGVIHRDLKPSNIMVAEYGQVYVMDWGIARLLPMPTRNRPPANGDQQPTTDESPNDETLRNIVTVSRAESADIDSPGTIVGTPRYMAPEQVHGQHQRTDHRADIFALGGTLYQLLTGHAPYTEKNYFALLVKVQNGEIDETQDDRVPAELERIARKAMARDPDDRYGSVGEMQKDVERFLRGVWHLPTRTFAPGEVIVREGDEGSSAYIIHRGRCRVLKDVAGSPIQLRLMEAGDVFGETAIFSSGRRSATVEALEEVEVSVVTSEVLTQGLGLNSWMGDFVKALATRFREADKRLAEASGEMPIVKSPSELTEPAE